MSEWLPEYQASRRDHAASTAGKLGSKLRVIESGFGDKDPHKITTADVQTWIGELIERGLKPGTISNYMDTLRLVLDFAGVDPNPARDKRVKLPTIVHEEVSPPTDHQFVALEKVSPAKCRLPLVVMEQTSMAIGETCQLAWGDVDVAGCRFRLRRRTVKGQVSSRARWPQVPPWLMRLIEETCPLEDRTPERRVFPGFSDGAARKATDRACKAAGVPVASPHDLRHRRLTIWYHGGVPAKVLAERAGHPRASMSLDVYSHHDAAR